MWQSVLNLRQSLVLLRRKTPNTLRRNRTRSLALECLDSRHLLASLALPPHHADARDVHLPLHPTNSVFDMSEENHTGGSGFDPNMAIVNGTPTNAFPSVGIVGDASGGFCSGTLIAPQVVLTAGHCAEGVGNTAGRFEIAGTTYATSQVIVHPQYNDALIGTDNANDLAVYRLNRPVTGVTPSPIYRTTPQVGQTLTLVGFGAGGTGNSGHDGSFGTKRVGTTPIDQVSTRLLLWRFDNNTESNTAPGDSGGPAFIQTGGVYYVAGVTSGGDQANAGIGDRSYDTRVDAYKTWIDTFLGGSNLPSVSIVAGDAFAAETTATPAVNRGTVTITRDGATTLPLTLGLSIGGSATNGVDYAAVGSSVTIPAGQNSVTLPVSPIDDSHVEGSESATFTILGGAGYSVTSGQSSATVQIADNDTATSNDYFAGRYRLSGSTVRTSGANRTATREAGEPQNAGIRGGRSVWWTWTAPTSGSVAMTTAGSSFDTTLGVYTGTSVAGLQAVASNDDQDYFRGIYTSQVVFQAVAGRTYQIMVDGYYGDSGNIQLGITLSGARSSTPAENTKPKNNFAAKADRFFRDVELEERFDNSPNVWGESDRRGSGWNPLGTRMERPTAYSFHTISGEGLKLRARKDSGPEI
jgi:Trypsin